MRTPSEATEEPQEYDDGGQVDPDKFVARLQAGIAKTKYAHIESRWVVSAAR